MSRESMSLGLYPASPIAVQTSDLFSRDKSKLLESLAMVMTRADLRLFLEERSSCSRTYLDTSCVKPLWGWRLSTGLNCTKPTACTATTHFITFDQSNWSSKRKNQKFFEKKLMASVDYSRVPCPFAHFLIHLPWTSDLNDPTKAVYWGFSAEMGNRQGSIWQIPCSSRL